MLIPFMQRGILRAPKQNYPTPALGEGAEPTSLGAKVLSYRSVRSTPKAGTGAALLS